MKATFEVPDELYRQVKAKSALEGRALREVAEELFRQYIEPVTPPGRNTTLLAKGHRRARRAIPPWFGVLGKHARRRKSHGMAAIRESIAAGLSRERIP